MKAIGDCNELLALDLHVGGMFTGKTVTCADLEEPVYLENLSYLRTNLPFGFVSADDVRYADMHEENLINFAVSLVSSLDWTPAVKQTTHTYTRMA